jgi:site-specific recombinase XerD
MSLVQRKGHWWLDIRIGGTRHRVTTGITVGSKAARDTAQRRAAEIELAIRTDGFGWKKTCPTVGAWWTTYRATYSVRLARPDRDDYTMSQALPVFGALRLDEVTPSQCLAYLDRRRASRHRHTGQPLREGTVQRERAMLHTFWQRAVDEDHLARNPWRTIPAARYEARDRTLTDAEQAAWLAELKPDYRRLAQVLLGTGLRIAECQGVKPATHLDLSQRRVTVLGKGKKWRTVPFGTALVPVLQAQLAEGWWTQSGTSIRQAFAGAARRAGIHQVSPHDLRHTFGHRWLRDGGDIYALSKLLGHASVVVTETHYAKLLQEDLGAAMDARNLGLAIAKVGA